MNESLLLRDATVQDIQLERLRRARWNALDGERVLAGLLGKCQFAGLEAYE